MSEESKPSPRVIRRGQAEPRVVNYEESELHSAELSDGRLVTFREITAGDLLFMEKTLAGAGEMERSLKLAARISTGEGRVTFEDLQKLKMKDIRVITNLLSDAGEIDDEEDEFPND